MPAVALGVDSLLHARSSKDMMTAPDTLLETEPEQESAKILETDVGVGSAAQNLLEQLAMLRHAAILPPLPEKLGALAPRV
jgi:hypothetical protein